MNVEFAGASDDETERPSVLHIPDASSAYAAYVVAYRGEIGPPVGLIYGAGVYRNHPVYLEVHGSPCCRTRLWVDHLQFEEYPFSDVLGLEFGAEEIRIKRWCGPLIVVPHARLNDFLGIIPEGPYR